MKLVFSLLLSLLFILPVPAANGPAVADDSPEMVRRTFSVEDFNAIVSGNRIRVVYTPTSGRVKVTADVAEEFLPDLNVQVTNGVLCLNLQKRKRWKNNTGSVLAVIYVNGPVVRRLEANSGSQVEVRQALETSSLEVVVSSGGTMDVPAFDVTDLKLDVSSGGRADFGDLHCKTLSADVSSGGRLFVRQLKQGGALRFDMNSGGRATFSDELSAEHLALDVSSGARLLMERLTCDEVTGSVSSGGRIECADTRADVVDVSCSSKGRATWGKEH